MHKVHIVLLGAVVIIFVGFVLYLEKAEAPSSDELFINQEMSMTMQLTSSAFGQNELIPSEYTCDGNNTYPPLSIAGVPEGTKSLVLVMDDPDIPAEIKTKMGIEKYNHWSVYNLSPDTAVIDSTTTINNQGLNSSGSTAYTGPCPPTQYEPTTHRYIFRLYAVPTELSFEEVPSLDQIESAAKESALASAQLIGLYSRVGQ